MPGNVEPEVLTRIMEAWSLGWRDDGGVEREPGDDASQSDSRCHVVVDAAHVGAQTRIDRYRLSGARAGEGRDIPIIVRHEPSSWLASGAFPEKPGRHGRAKIPGNDPVGIALCAPEHQAREHRDLGAVRGTKAFADTRYRVWQALHAPAKPTRH